MPDVLEKRYEQYFRHPDDEHDVLDVGDRAAACSNIRQALGMLGIETPSVDSTVADLYDNNLKEAVRTFQTRFAHRVADGLVGPGTRVRLVSELLHRLSPSIFARLRRPVMEPSIGLS